MKHYLTTYSTTQSQVGVTRPRLFTLDDLCAELGQTRGELTSLVSKYGIKPPFPPKGGSPKQYRKSDFQEALNQKGGNYTIEKGIPVPPRDHAKAGKYRPILDALEVGDSLVMELCEATAMMQFARNKYPGYKLATRKVDEDTRRVWRTE